MSFFRTALVRLGAAVAVIVVAALHTHTQITRAGLKEMLRQEAGFTQQHFERLNAGEVVVVPQSGSSKQVISVCGIVRIKRAPELSLAQFRESLSQRGNKARTSGGIFSTPPTAADLTSMELSDKDLADLRECRIGDCNLGLRASAIERFRTEVDWSSPDPRRQAEQLMRDVLAGYAADYQSGGDEALGRFDNRKEAPALAAIHRSILNETLLLRDLAPDLFEHLTDFPKSGRSDIEDELGWATVEFGLKPMVVLTHSAIFSSSAPDGARYAIAAKQFYANHYLDSSLAVTYLIRVAGDEGAEMYVLFTDRSRSNTLRGVLGSIARDLVEKEAVDRVEKMLDTVHLNILAEEYRRSNPEAAAGSSTQGSAIDIFRRPWVLAMLLAGIAALGALLYFRKRKQ